MCDAHVHARDVADANQDRHSADAAASVAFGLPYHSNFVYG